MIRGLLIVIFGLLFLTAYLFVGCIFNTIRAEKTSYKDHNVWINFAIAVVCVLELCKFGYFTHWGAVWFERESLDYSILKWVFLAILVVDIIVYFSSRKGNLKEAMKNDLWHLLLDPVYILTFGASVDGMLDKEDIEYLAMGEKQRRQ